MSTPTDAGGGIAQGYWAAPVESLFGALTSAASGLASAEALARLRAQGAGGIGHGVSLPVFRILVRQFSSPLVLILILAAAISAFVGSFADSAIVLAIVLGSGTLGAVQEQRASKAVALLRERVQITVNALRDGRRTPVPSAAIVPGDVVLLSAGSLVPGDGVILESKDLFLQESSLTGESVPVEKRPGCSARESGITERNNCVFMGTSVRSGTASVLIVATGPATAYGAIAGRLALHPPETEFERGLRAYGYLLTEIMVLLVLVVFAANVFLARPTVDALLFAIALAVGISPELLPAIISVTLAAGARDMARHGVIVRQLEAIENLGSMTVLCTDKTGTLTRGVLELESAVDADGLDSIDVLRLACINANLQTGLANPLDEAIGQRGVKEGIELAACRRLDEVPYDFDRKRLSVAVEESGSVMLVTKGAVPSMLDVCTSVRRGGGTTPLDAARRAELEAAYDAWSAAGTRVLAVAAKPVPRAPRYGRADEQGLELAGFLLFSDPPKPGVETALAALARLGVRLKIVTGDNRLVARRVAEAVGLPARRILTGAEVARLGEAALASRVKHVDLFAEVDPGEKERIVLAMKRSGEVVGYLGDGINDAPAMHAADVGVSVELAVDVAREAADFVLLEHDLEVLCRGVEQGRKTLANTVKYLSITTSANFGNMLSMAAASLFMPFLPLLAKQILLNNFLSDIPAMTVASDNVDPELTVRPGRWDMRAVRRFMIGFGVISSVFDLLTFATLLLVFHAGPELFRTGWFIESLLTELAIALVLRTRRAFYRSVPGKWLTLSSGAVALAALGAVYLPFARELGFVPLPLPVLAALLLITVGYVAVSEAAKRVFPTLVAPDRIRAAARFGRRR